MDTTFLTIAKISKTRCLSHYFFQIFLFVLFYQFVIPIADSNEAPITTSSTSSSVSEKTLLAKIKEVEASTTLDVEMRTKLVEIYRKALSYQETSRSNEKNIAAFKRARKEASGKAKQIRVKLEKALKLNAKIELQVTKQSTISEVEQQISKGKANLALLESQFADIQQQLSYESERSSIVSQRLVSAKKELEENKQLLAAPQSDGKPSQFKEAQLWLIQEQADTIRSETRMLDVELSSQPMRIDLLEAQRSKVQYSIEQVKASLALLADIMNDLQRSHVLLAAEKATAEELNAKNKHPSVQALAEKNVELGNLSGKIVNELSDITELSETIANDINRISEEFRFAEQKLQIDGVSEALGKVLLKQGRNLPDVTVLDSEINHRGQLIADASLRQIQFREERRSLRSTKKYITILTEKLSPGEIDNIRDDLQNLIDSRRILLKKAISLNKSYLNAQEELDGNQKKLIKVVSEYDEFLAVHLLWIRSTPPISIAVFKLIPEQLVVFFSFDKWHQVGTVFMSQLNESTVSILSLLLVSLLILKVPSMYRKVYDFTKLANNPLREKISDILKALGFTMLIASVWPVFTAVLGDQLATSLESTQFTDAVSIGLLNMSPVFFFFNLFYVLIVPGGVAATHFSWPEKNLIRFRRSFRWFMLLFLPLIFIIIFISNYHAHNLGIGLGRLSLVLTLILFGVMAYHMFRINRVFSTKVLELSNAKKLRYPLVFIGILLPVFLSIIAMLGYMYTAVTLMKLLLYTLWFAFALLLVHQLSVRWLTMAQRRIKYQMMLDKRAELEKAKIENKDNETDEIPPVTHAEDLADNLITLNLESRKLLNMAMAILSVMGLWWIWSDILPAFSILNDVTLWYSSGHVDGAEQLVSVTLADLGVALLIAFITIVGVRSIPALIELVLLQRLSLNTGSSYATTTLTRYAIITLGTMLSLNAIGASWSQVQWLVAALSVGIGFGLQEIVANFISGLIILFERPIRVGDVVTVGDSTGTVTRIQIRATTILTYDRQELLVPNKEFITERLLNWSLSDPMSRIVLPVGIAYGADVDTAMSIMKEVAENNERILSNPAPFVIFENFGDNSLLLNLRCYVGSIDYRLSVIGELHVEINRRFSDANISISFPQRDIHLDTSSPLDIRVHRMDANPDGLKS